MRTTLTLDPDVAVLVERKRKETDASLKDVINEALRLGLREMEAPKKARKPFRTRVHNGGRPLIENLDNVAEILALVEGEDYK